jgi:hypothetical protein
MDDLVQWLREVAIQMRVVGMARCEEAADRIEALEMALCPFARVIEEQVTGDFPDDHPAWSDGYSPIVSDFKRAYELVGDKKDASP